MMNEWVDYLYPPFPTFYIHFIMRFWRFFHLNNLILSTSFQLHHYHPRSSYHQPSRDLLLTLHPCFSWALLQSILLLAVGVIFEYRNLVLSCSCLNDFRGFLCCGDQHHNPYSSLQGPGWFSPLQFPISFSALQPIILTTPDVTMPCSFQPQGLCICSSTGNLLLPILCYISPVHSLDLSSHVIYLRKLPESFFLLPLPPHKIGSTELPDLIELHFPIIALKRSSNRTFISMIICLLFVVFIVSSMGMRVMSVWFTAVSPVDSTVPYI